jgi:hypothetical protein
MVFFSISLSLLFADLVSIERSPDSISSSVFSIDKVPWLSSSVSLSETTIMSLSLTTYIMRGYALVRLWLNYFVMTGTILISSTYHNNITGLQCKLDS